MTRRYTLDLTGAKFPEWWPGWAKILPMTDGLHMQELDVLESEIHPARLGEFRRLLAEHNADDFRRDLPVGTNLDKMPIGAVLRVEGRKP